VTRSLSRQICSPLTRSTAWQLRCLCEGWNIAGPPELKADRKLPRHSSPLTQGEKRYGPSNWVLHTSEFSNESDVSSRNPVGESDRVLPTGKEIGVRRCLPGRFGSSVMRARPPAIRDRSWWAMENDVEMRTRLSAGWHSDRSDSLLLTT